MPTPSNADVAHTLDRYATLLDIAGGNVFKIRAYRRAAEGVRALAEPLAAVRADGRLAAIDGVGAGIAAALDELIDHATFQPWSDLQRELPASVLDLLNLPGIGAKTAGRLFRDHGIADLPGLESALAAGRLRGVPGIGGKTEAALVAGLAALKRRTGRSRLGIALPAGRRLADAIRDALPGSPVSLAGSTRRWEETVGDLNLIVGSAFPERALSAIAGLTQASTVTDRTAQSVRLKLHGGGPEAHVLIVTPAAFGTALVRATGTAAHLALLPAVLPEASSEEEVYARLGLPWIPPELRQGADEITRGIAGDIDRLITAADVQGEFHAHTIWSDGSASIAEMAAAAAGVGYRFLGISDHSGGLGVANGLTTDRLITQRGEIEAVGATGPVRLFAAAEVEVGRDGALDFNDATLAGLDLAIASLHSGLRQPRATFTDRLIATLEHPGIDIVAHPSGRLIEQREGADVDWDRAFATAARTGTALEINANPARLDLNAALARRAADAGCLLTINCDAHHPEGFAVMEYGIAVARRAWLRPDQVLNCWALDRVEAWLAARGR